jgi:hypothetical protein
MDVSLSWSQLSTCDAYCVAQGDRKTVWGEHHLSFTQDHRCDARHLQASDLVYVDSRQGNMALVAQASGVLLPGAQ